MNKCLFRLNTPPLFIFLFILLPMKTAMIQFEAPKKRYSR